MNNDFILALDLGTDTLKVAYGFNNNGVLEFGKITNENNYITGSFNASAYYDEAQKKWYYADEIDNNFIDDFYNVVKIKNLLSLLAKRKDNSIADKNEYYFTEEHYFPKYYFPQRISILNNFETMVNKKMTFTAYNSPYDVCKGYFDYVSNIIKEQIYAIMNKNKVSLKVSIVLIYPTGYGMYYVNKLKDIIESSFGYHVEMYLNSTRAVSYSAIFTEKLQVNDEALIFDIGEEKTSVLKVNVRKKDEISIDSSEGHLAPANIGGYTIDEDILKKINNSIGQIPIFGSQSTEFNEQPLESHQYKLINDIKLAKMMLSTKNYESLSIDVVRELIYNVDFNQMMLREIVNGNFLDLISKYIIKELKLSNNENVTKVILTGGPIETSKLFYLLKIAINIKFPKVVVDKVDYSIDKYNNTIHNSLKNYEYSIYSAALGGVFALNNGYKMKTLLSLTYGTYIINRKDNKKLFSIIANKGKAISEGNNVYGEKYNVGDKDKFNFRVPEEYYSINISEEDILKRKHSDVIDYTLNGFKPFLLIDEKDGSREKAKKHIGFKVVSGGKKGNGKDSFIIFKDKAGNRICVKGLIFASCKLTYDFMGNVKPSIINVEVTKKEVEYIVYQKEFEKKYPKGFLKDTDVYLKDIKRIDSKDIILEYLNLNEFNSSYEE